MKRKIQLITGSIIILLVAILSAYYLGFLNKNQVKLEIYSSAENEKVNKYLESISNTDKDQEKKEFRDKLFGLSFQHKQNIVHYAFNYGNPHLFFQLFQDPKATSDLFKQKDGKGHKPIYYYQKYCQLTNIKPLKDGILGENPLKAIEHILGYLCGSEDNVDFTADASNGEDTLISAIEEGKLEDVQNFLFSSGGNDKALWEKALKALSDLRSTVPKKREIEQLLKTLKADRDEKKEDFWQKVRKFLDRAPNVAAMVNYLHKLVVTSPKKKSLLYYIMKVGGLRSYQMYKHIEMGHEPGTKTAFSDLLLAANDPHNPIKLVVNPKDDYKRRLNKEIEKLKSYISIDPNIFARINPEYRDSLTLTEFKNKRTFFHACVLNEAPKKLERSCAQYLKHNDKFYYDRNWSQADVFGLKPADYFPLVKDSAKKQHLRFLQEGILAPTKEEIHFLKSYKAKAKELELGDLNFDGWITKGMGLVFVNQKDTKRNICHIAVLIGDLDAIKFLSDNYPNFKALCEGEDTYGKTPAAYAECRLNEQEKQQMCSYLTTTFGIKEQISQASLEKAIKECNWQQIGKWQKEETNAFGAIWAEHGSALLHAIPKEKPTTILGQSNYLKLLELLSKCDTPSNRMVQDHKALMDETNISLFLGDDAIGELIKEKAELYTRLEAEDLTLQGMQKNYAYVIPDHTKQNKTTVHKLLPKVVVDYAAEEFKDLLEKNPSLGEAFRIALCMVDNNKNTPLDLVKKALKDKNNNAKDVTAKLDIIKKYEKEHLAGYKREYTYNTKETAASLYKKGNYKGLVAYLKCPASYMSRSLLETMVEDGAYDVIKEVCNTNNPYVISAAKALMAIQEGDNESRLTALLNKDSVKKAIKFRCLLKSKQYLADNIDIVVTSLPSDSQRRQIERMWRAHPVYCAIIVNKLAPAIIVTKILGNRETSDSTQKFIIKLYRMYHHTGITAAEKKKYKFNNAHVAVIHNQQDILRLYAQDSTSQLKTWLKQADRMGRTPLDYINYGKGKTSDHTKALFQFISELTPLNAQQILKSPNAVRWLDYAKVCPPYDYESLEKARRMIFLDQKGMLEKLAKKAKAGRNSLHYACLGIDSDIEWFLKLLEEGEYTVEAIDKEDINSCTPLDYVPDAHREKVKQIFAIFREIAYLKKAVESSTDIDFNPLITAAKACKLNHKTLELSSLGYGKTKKFWRKKWICDLFEADTWLSSLDVKPNRNATYLPRLYSVLLKPAYKDIAEALIAKQSSLGISLNEKDSEGKTWLIKAIEKEQWAIAALLVNAGVDLSQTDIYDTDAQFLTIVHLESNDNDGDLKDQLLAYIQKQEDMKWSDKTKQWFSKRWKQIFYVPESSLEELKKRGAKIKGWKDYCLQKCQSFYDSQQNPSSSIA